MTLTKGFLNREFVIKRHRLITGIILWIMISYILYAFFYHCREAFRILTGELGGRILLVLDTEENFIYNLFYASVASALGFIFSLNFVLNSYVLQERIRTKMLIRRILNDGGFFSWSFLLFFGKLTSLLGVLYLSIPMQFDIDFLKEFPLLLALLPVVTFLSAWPGLRQVLGPKKLQWSAALLLFFIVMSFIFAFKDFFEIEKINHNLRKNSIDYLYTLNLPRSTSHQMVKRMSIVVDIYVAKDSLGNPLIFFRDVNTQVELSEVIRQLSMERDKLSEIERFQLVGNLHVAEGVSMSFMNKLKYEFRRAHLYEIQYSTGPEDAKYPSNHAAYKYSGMQQSLHPKYYPKFEAFLDSAESVDFSKHKIRLPESRMYRTNSLNGYNRIAIYVDDQKTTLNGAIVQKEELEPLVYKFIKKYSPNFVIIFNTDESLSFGKYIEQLDLIYSQIDKLRNELSLELYQRLYDHWDRNEETNHIKSKYPRNILEWSYEEKRLQELMKKANNQWQKRRKKP